MNSNLTPSPQRRWHGRWFLGLVAAGTASLAIAAAVVRGDLASRDQQPTVVDVEQTGQAFAAVSQRVSPAVVYIKVQHKHAAGRTMTPNQNAPEWFNDEWLERFFGDRRPKFGMPEMPPRSRPHQPWHSNGQGSGFIINKDGYILTNAHVVDGAEQVEVTLADGRRFDAKIVGTDPRSDVAVIKVDGHKLPVLPMGNSDDIEVGRWVLAVGNPFGLSGTVTSGIVSAKGRSSVGIADYENFIQTDAAINPGNSGGPLVNLKGEAIGINTAIFSRSGGYMGIGFAIPINMARDICDQLIHDGSVTRGYLGIAIQELTPELAQSFGMDSTDGVLVSDVTKDSPAHKAGLQSGDVIVEFDGKAVKKIGPFRNLVAHATPKRSVKLAVLRDGKRQKLTVAIGTLPAKDDVARAEPSSVEPLGLTIKPLSDELKERYGYQDDSGVVVTHVQSGSKAALAGIEPGMLIKAVNRQPVHTVKEFRQAMDDGSDKETVLLLVQKGEYSRFVALPLHEKQSAES